VHPEAKHPLKRNKPDQGPQNHLAPIKTATTRSISFQFFSFFLQLYSSLELSERRGFRGPGHLVSGADWIPGTASTPVSLSNQSDEA